MVTDGRDTGGMNTVFAAGMAILGMLPFVFSPTRTFARGGVWKYVGAALIVISAMMLFLSVRDLTGEGAGDDSMPAVSDADLKALEKLF